MKFQPLNFLIIVLSVIYKLSVYGQYYVPPQCEEAYNWIKFPVKDNCCVINDDPFFCNINDKIDAINLTPKYTEYPGFLFLPIFDELTSLQINDKIGYSYSQPFPLYKKIFEQPSLKTLIVNTSYVNDIATDISPDCPIEEISLKNTQIKNFPNSIFKMNNLKKIELENNTLMNVKIVKFKNSPIECNFENTNVDCYQEGACSNLSSTNYKKCTDDEIKEILGSDQTETANSNSKDNSNSENKNKSNGIIIAVIIGICVVIIIIIIALVFIVKKINKKDKLNDKLDNYIDFEIYEKRHVILNEIPESANNQNTIDDRNSEKLIYIQNNSNNNVNDNDNLNPPSTVIPIIDNSNNTDNNSILPSYTQLENSNKIQPIKNVDFKKKI